MKNLRDVLHDALEIADALDLPLVGVHIASAADALSTFIDFPLPATVPDHGPVAAWHGSRSPLVSSNGIVAAAPALCMSAGPSVGRWSVPDR